MIGATSMWFRLLVLAVVSFVSAAIVWPVGSASGQPLFQGSLACPATAPSGQQVAQGLLSNITNPLNNAWIQSQNAAKTNIDKQTITLSRVHIPNGCNSSVDNFCLTKLAGGHCSFVYVDMTVQQLNQLGALRFTNLIPAAVNQKNVAAHTNRGPDASVITDGVFAPEGWDASDPAYAIVLPHNGAKGALVIDLGKTVSVCGVSSACTAPKIQADNDDVYQLDYSVDGTTWKTLTQFPKTGGTGLHTRSLSSSSLPSSFSARYVAIYATSGGNTFAISELQLWDTSNHLVSVGKPTVGPVPFEIVDGANVSEGTSAADANVSVVLVHKTGSATALMVDLGKVKDICGNKFLCGHEPTIQADNDDIYMFDYSIDGKNWTTYGFMDDSGGWHGTFPSVGGTGLHTRDMNCSARPDPSTACSQTNEGPNFSARYVRVYARDGGDTFAVSELKLWDTSGIALPTAPFFSNPQAYAVAAYFPHAWGPEPFFINGEFAPEGTSSTDTHWVQKLGDCTATASCPPAALSGPPPISSALGIDLTAEFPISGITIQADHNDTYHVDVSNDGTAWTTLWVVPTVTDGGLRTRTTTFGVTSTSPKWRYVRVYATLSPGQTKGDGQYSVSELQVFTPQANTAGEFATSVDNQGFIESDGRANDGQNFVCSYDGTFNTALAVSSGSSVQPFSTLPITFFVSTVSLNARCVNSTTGGDFNIASASNRSCSMTLVPPAGYGPAFTDQYQAGLCAEGQAILSYMNMGDKSDNTNPAIQFASKDDVFGTQQGSDLQCNDFGSLDAHIPDVLRGFVPQIAAGAVTKVVNGILDYHLKPNSLIPFPPGTVCAAPTAEVSPHTAFNVQGSASNVGTNTDSGSVSVSGRFTAESPLDLAAATLTVSELLDEIGGVGELVKGAAGAALLPITLSPRTGGTPTGAIYETPAGARPSVRVEVKTRDVRTGLTEFSIRVDRATIPNAPETCVPGVASSAGLTTAFSVQRRTGLPVSVHFLAEWRCSRNALRTP